MLKIALTNLGKYNEGELVYKWLELPASQEEIDETLEAIGIDGVVYEEYFISDYETDIENLEVKEYENIDYLNQLIEEYESLDTYDQEVVQAIIEAHGCDLEDAMGILRDGNYSYYPGCHSLEDLAYEMVEEGLFGDPKQMANLVNYIDYERLGRDLGFDVYTETSNGVIRID